MYIGCRDSAARRHRRLSRLAPLDEMARRRGPGAEPSRAHSRSLLADGLAVCYTLDAGPNVHCISLRKDADSVRDALKNISGVVDIRLASVGGSAQVVIKR